MHLATIFQEVEKLYQSSRFMFPASAFDTLSNVLENGPHGSLTLLETSPTSHVEFWVGITSNYQEA